MSLTREAKRLRWGLEMIASAACAAGCGLWCPHEIAREVLNSTPRLRVHYRCMKPTSPTFICTDDKVLVSCSHCDRMVNLDATGDPVDRAAT